jgi:hypothetical protein
LYTFVLRTEIHTKAFELKVVQISARNTITKDSKPILLSDRQSAF